MATGTPLAPLHKGSHGPHVKKLQNELNETSKNHGLYWLKVQPDGKLGNLTLKTAALDEFAMGLSRAQIRKTNSGIITVHAQQILRHDLARSRWQKHREHQREDRIQEIIRHHRASQVTRSGISTWRGVTVAGWMVGTHVGPNGRIHNWLQDAVDHGWSGGVYSGFRTPAYSTSLCEAKCGAPTCPGTCAGAGSNHSGFDGSYPGWGAIDVEDRDGFEHAMTVIGGPLINRLPLDTNHFSVTGN